jgi:CysZ protein
MVAVTALSLVALFVALFFVVPDALALLWARPAGWWQVAWYAVAVLFFSVALVVGVATVPAVVTAPLADPLVAATERHFRLPAPGGGGIGRFAAETAGGIAKALLRVGLLLAGHALLLPLWLIPGAGHAAWTALSVAWTVFWLVFEYLDLPANRFGYRFREVGAAVRANPAVSAGFGVAVYLLLWVPLLNTLFIPAATVGATLLFHELRAAGRIRPAAIEA